MDTTTPAAEIDPGSVCAGCYLTITTAGFNPCERSSFCPPPCEACLGVGRVIDVYADDDESTRKCGQCFGTGNERVTPSG